LSGAACPAVCGETWAWGWQLTGTTALVVKAQEGNTDTAAAVMEQLESKVSRNPGGSSVVFATDVWNDLAMQVGSAWMKSLERLTSGPGKAADEAPILMKTMQVEVRVTKPMGWGGRGPPITRLLDCLSI
jgi:hypothetical protein